MPDDFGNYITSIFLKKQALEQGVIRRSIRDVEFFSKPGELRRACEKLGFRLYKSRTQYVIFCEAEPPQQIV